MKAASLICAAVLWEASAAASAKERAADHPVLITAEQAAAAPYRFSGRMEVQYGGEFHFGTATRVRRYTALTAAHVLYHAPDGFADRAAYNPALHGQPNARTVPAGSLTVLSGYQDAADVDSDSDAAFQRDMGYVLLVAPAPDDEWAAWSADPRVLEDGSRFLLFGYAAERFPGTRLAAVEIQTPFRLISAPGLYETDTCYIERGMSGGPVHATGADGLARVAAIMVAGDPEPRPALSDVRAITAGESDFLLDAEYDHGFITGGAITGRAAVSAGSTVRYKTAVAFEDGAQETGRFALRYEEAILVPSGPNKRAVTVTRLRPGKYALAFSPELPAGAQVSFKLLRGNHPARGQRPLAKLTVTIL